MTKKITEKAQDVENRERNPIERCLIRLLEPFVKGERYTYFSFLGLSLLFGSVIFTYSRGSSLKESGFSWFLFIVCIFFAVAGIISLHRKCSTHGKKQRDKSEAKQKKYSAPGLVASIFLGISTPVLQKLYDIGFKNLPPDDAAQVVKETVNKTTLSAEICETPPQGISSKIFIRALENEKLKLNGDLKESFEKYFEGSAGTQEGGRDKSEILVDMTRGMCVNDNPLEAFFGVNTLLGFLSFFNLSILAFLTLLMLVGVIVHFHSGHPWNIVQQFSAKIILSIFIPIIALFLLAFLLSPVLGFSDSYQLLFVLVVAVITSIAAFYLPHALEKLIKDEKKKERLENVRKEFKEALEKEWEKRKQEEDAHAVRVSESKGMFAYKKWARRFPLTHLLLALIAIIYASIRWIAPIQSCDQVNDSTSSVR